MSADAGRLTEMITYPAEYRWNGVVRPCDVDRIIEPSLTHGTHVGRDVLGYGAVIHTGRLYAVEQAELAVGLGPVGAERFVDVSPVLTSGLCIATQVDSRECSHGERCERVGVLIVVASFDRPLANDRWDR